MRKFWYIFALIFFTVVALYVTSTFPTINMNNRFVLYIVVACIDIAVLIILYVAKHKLMRNIILTVVGMSAFGFLLVPLYNVFCEVTGLNGKLDLTIAEAPTGIDRTRQITVEFVVSQNAEMPWDFKPKHHSVVLHPGQLMTTAYFAKNKSSCTMFAQAIPSITPAKARKYFKKVECFCFNKQKLGPGETAHFGLRFYLDPEIPQDVQRVTLAYTIFDITQQER